MFAYVAAEPLTEDKYTIKQCRCGEEWYISNGIMLNNLGCYARQFSEELLRENTCPSCRYKAYAHLYAESYADAHPKAQWNVVADAMGVPRDQFGQGLSPISASYYPTIVADVGTAYYAIKAARREYDSKLQPYFTDLDTWLYKKVKDERGFQEWCEAEEDLTEEEMLNA